MNGVDSIGSPVTEGGVLDFGFDLKTTGLDELHNITSFGLFPNPARGGRFNVSFEAAQAVQSATVTVYNPIGQAVYRQEHRQPGTSMFREVVLGSVPAGVYFAEIVADGDRIVRRVVVE